MLLSLAAALVVLAGVEAVVLLAQPGAPGVLVLFPLAALSWFAAGAVAALRRPGNRMGAIMAAGAIVWIVAGLGNAPHPALAAPGLVVATLPLALVVHLLHAFPSGRLRGTASRAIVVAIYATALILHAPGWLFRPDGAGAPLMIADDADLARLGLTIQDVVGGSLMVATGALLALRLRAATPQQRRVLAPLALYGIAAVVLVPLLSDLDGPLLGGDPLALFAAQTILVGLVPVAFVGAVLRGGFAPTAGAQELSAWLGADGGARPPLRDALAEALGDPSVELALWAGERDGWVTGDGRPVTLPQPRSGRGVVMVDAGGGAGATVGRRIGAGAAQRWRSDADGDAGVAPGRRVGAIVYDATLIADPAPVREAAGVIALALDRERLTAELLASRDGLRRSGARIAAAADEERRRIARDLHDGVQGRLVLLAMRAGELARDDGSSAAVRADADALRRELEATLAALRELVAGVLPAALVERGLGVAVEELADRMPLPTTVAATDARFPADVESAAWFVIAEALANAVKHARARTLAVRVAATATGLRVEVRDDGIGGAGGLHVHGGGRGPRDGAGPDPGRTGPRSGGAEPHAGGTGLRGLADRVDVLGGRLAVESPPGGGTRIVAEIPCGS